MNEIHSQNDQEVFWKLVEEKHGAVLSFGLAQYICPPIKEDGKLTYWGLCYITDTGIYFYHFPQKSLFDNLMGKKESSDFCVGIPLENVKSWRCLLPESKSFFQRIFKKQTVGLLIEGISKHYSLRDDMPQEKETSAYESVLSTHTFLLDFKAKEMMSVFRLMIGDKEEFYERK